MGKSNGGTRASSSNSPKGIPNKEVSNIEERELASIRNSLARYNEARTATTKERARFSVNSTINIVQMRIEQSISNLNDNNPSEAEEIKRLRKYYDTIGKMRV